MKRVLDVLKSICEIRKNFEKKNEVEVSLTRLMQVQGSVERWNNIILLFKKTKDDRIIQDTFIRELTLGLMYPKLDAHVSAQANHLLKCPFNVHHDTGNLSLPIEDIDKFDVSKCPTIFDALSNDSGALLEPYMKIFDRFCEKLVDKSVIAGQEGF